MIWRSDLVRADQLYRSASDPDQTTIRSKAINKEAGPPIWYPTARAQSGRHR